MRRSGVLGVSLAIVLSGMLALSPAFDAACFAADENTTDEGGESSGSTESSGGTESGGSSENSTESGGSSETGRSETGSTESSGGTESSGSSETGENAEGAENSGSSETGENAEGAENSGSSDDGAGSENGGSTESSESSGSSEDGESTESSTENGDIEAESASEENAEFLPEDLGELLEELSSPLQVPRMLGARPMMMLGASPTDAFSGYDTPQVTPNSVTFHIVPNAGTSYSELKYSFVNTSTGEFLVDGEFPPSGYSGADYEITQTGLVAEVIYAFHLWKHVDGSGDVAHYEYTFSIPAIPYPEEEHHSSHHDTPSAPVEDPNAIKLSYSSHESGGSVSATVGSKPLASGMNLISMTGFTVATALDAEGGAIFTKSPFGGEILTSSVSGKLQEGVSNQIVTMTGGIVLSEENVTKLMERTAGGEIKLETKVSADAAASLSEEKKALVKDRELFEFYEINLYANGERVHDVPVELRLPNTVPDIPVSELVLIAFPENENEEIAYYPLALDPVTGELVALVPHLSTFGTARTAVNGRATGRSSRAR